MSKPFDIEELVAKIITVYRRRHVAPDSMLCDDILTLAPARHIFRVGEVGVRLTATEFGIVWRLGLHFGDWLSASELSASALGGASQSNIDDLRVHISNIRAKIEPFAETIKLETKRNVGTVS